MLPPTIHTTIRIDQAINAQVILRSLRRLCGRASPISLIELPPSLGLVGWAERRSGVRPAAWLTAQPCSRPRSLIGLDRSRRVREAPQTPDRVARNGAAPV